MKHGNSIYMLRSVRDDICDSFIITTRDGKIIVVDGGYGFELPRLADRLRRITGQARPRIDAWFLTHAHDDHMEAFLQLLEKREEEIDFDRVYVNFPEHDFYKQTDEWAYNMLRRYEALRHSFAEKEVVLRDGDELNIGEARIKILYVFDPAFISANEGSLIFRMELGGKSVLFTGDCEPNACAKVLANPEYRPLLKCDICKMSHHGQNGATREFYEAVSPEICLWPTPTWVWNNVNGNLKTFETRRWIKEMGIGENHISKDGDVFLDLDSPRRDPLTAGLNPFLPFGTYIPDGEPKVFGDRVYLYGSYDLLGEGYCCGEYHVMSAPVSDLTKWTDHGQSFSNRNVPWSDALLYAPDALYRNGKYYLFFCLSDGSEGVAESEFPEGPFTDAKRVTMNGKPIEGIDPSVLDDGDRVVYTWGQFSMKAAELEDDMCTLRPETCREGVITNSDGKEGFHEGSSLRKLGDKYCLVYASEYTAKHPNKGGRPTKLDYALADSPYGPYTRMGTIIDNDGCDPESWNDHGSIIKIGDKWFVFYHASSNATAFSRRARAERIIVDEDNCSITQAKPTTNGFRKSLLPENIVYPANARRFSGGAYLTQTHDGLFPAVCPAGAEFEFSPAEFAAGRYRLTLRYVSSQSAEAEVLLGGKTAAVIPLPCAPEGGSVGACFETDAGSLSVSLTFSDETQVGECRITKA